MSERLQHPAARQCFSDHCLHNTYAGMAGNITLPLVFRVSARRYTESGPGGTGPSCLPAAPGPTLPLGEALATIETVRAACSPYSSLQTQLLVQRQTLFYFVPCRMIVLPLHKFRQALVIIGAIWS